MSCNEDEEYIGIKKEIKIEEEVKSENVSDLSMRYDDSDKTQELKLEETLGESSQSGRPKILVQRVFHQPEKHVVEQKLDYVIANSEEEITKHVYGGLFRSKFYKYAPESYCQKHAPNLYEHQDETLVKLGDKFDSEESFRLYVDGNAKRWKYYLKCADSHRKNGIESFVFQCVFAKQRHKQTLSKGLRKRTIAVPKGDCPCRVLLKPVPYDAKDYTVIYVCNHHDHPLTDEYFSKLQHGRRIHPSIKAEIMDLLSLEVDREVVRKYFESLTGYSMHGSFFNNMFLHMKKNKIERQFSLEKLKEMSKKIEKIKEELGMGVEEDNVDNDLSSDDNIKNDNAAQVAEVFNVLKTVSRPRRERRRGRRRRNPEFEVSTVQKRQKMEDEGYEDDYINTTHAEPSSPQKSNNQSRLETRLEQLQHDRETLRSIKHLQNSVRYEAENNPWLLEDVTAEGIEGTAVQNNEEAADGDNEPEVPVNSTVETEQQNVIVESTDQDQVSYVDNQDIVYENEITVGDNSQEVVNCVNIGEIGEINLNENYSFCIQYDDGQEGEPSEQYVLMLDGTESFENLSELQIQATKMATINIGTDEQRKDVADEMIHPNDLEDSHQNDITDAQQPEVIEQICLMNDAGIEILGDNTVFEVIRTDDRKILPSKEIVHNVILKKPPKMNRRSSGRNASYTSNNWPRQEARTSKETKVIRKYFEEKLESYMADEFKDEIETLGEDECYMIVVEDEENGNNECHDVMAALDNYEVDQTINSSEVTNNENVMAPHENVTSVQVEDIHPVVNNVEYGNVLTIPEDQIVHAEDIAIEQTIGSEVDLLSEQRAESEKELLELHTAIQYLKQQKVSLKKDIEHLIATKDDLIEDITKAARLARRIRK